MINVQRDLLTSAMVFLILVESISPCKASILLLLDRPTTEQEEWPVEDDPEPSTKSLQNLAQKIFKEKMIEPLRYNREHYPTYEIARPVFCHACLCQKNSRLDPNIAIKFCPKCPSTLGADKDYGAFLCASCDDTNHKAAAAKDHVRLIVVVGPGVRKKVIVRGDGKNFPLPLDKVSIKLSSRIYQNGKRVHRIRTKEISFISGMSGRCLHVQVLGARNLMIGDLHGSSDPFIVYSFCGKPLGTTRVRPRSTNPRWDNETFIVPMDENLPAPRDMPQSQKDLVRLEVYDHDWVTNSEFLGHVEITRSKLAKIAAVSNQLPIRLPLTMKEYHGFVNLQFGYDENFLYVKAVRAENLNMMSASTLSNPYVKIYLGGSYLVGTTTTLAKTINPHWHSGNVFKVKMLQYLFAERYALSQIDAYNETQERLARARGDTSRHYQSGSESQLMDEFSNLPTSLALFRIEIYHENRWTKHQLLGKAFISVHKLRRMLPTLPAADVANLNGYAEYAVTTARADQLSAKQQAKEDSDKDWWSFLRCCGKRRIRSRPNSPDDKIGVPGAMGRAPSAPPAGAGAGLDGLTAPGVSNRRRGNLLGAASAGGAAFAAPPGQSAKAPSGPVAMQLPPQQPQAQPPVPYPPSVRPAPPPMQSATSEGSFGFSSKSDASAPALDLPGLSTGLSNRRRARPLAINTSNKSDSSSTGDQSQQSQRRPDISPAPAQPGPETSPSNPAFSRQGSGDLGSGRQSRASEEKSDIEQGPSEAMQFPMGDVPLNPLDGGGSLAAGSLASLDSWDQSGAVIGDIEQAQEKVDAVIFPPTQSSRPPPPALPTIADVSTSAAPSSVRDGDTSENATTNTANVRAPFLRGSENSSNSLVSRKSKRNLLGLSFRSAASEVVWSESYPFPIMLDLGAHRGVDALGNPVSQGFIVLRLIPATRGTVVLGLDEAVRQMTLGETAQVKCRFDYAYGSFSMGSNIPPRANVIFKVKLLEINGAGRYQVLYRQFVRFTRWFTRVYAAWKNYWYGEEEIGPSGEPSRKMKRQQSFSVRLLQGLGLSSRMGTAGSDSESSESSESEEEQDGGQQEGAHAEGPGMEGSEDGSSVDSSQQYERRVKPDPRMRKHLNQSVTAGASLMWNFKPVVKAKKPKAPPAKKPVTQSKPLPTVAEQPADDREEKQDSEGEFGDNGDDQDDRQPLLRDSHEQQVQQIRNMGGGIDYDDGYGMDGAADSAPEQEDRNESDDGDD